MFVVAQVSSMNTRWAGSRSGWLSNHAQRRLRTSERSCSAAYAVFLREKWCRPKKRHSVPKPTDTPASVISVRISFSVTSGCRSTKPRISVGCASIVSERQSSPSALGVTERVLRSNAYQRTALAALTPKRAAAARQDAPAALATTTRSRKSTDSALDMPVSLQHRQAP
jgi:hypothetical protein